MNLDEEVKTFLRQAWELECTAHEYPVEEEIQNRIVNFTWAVMAMYSMEKYAVGINNLEGAIANALEVVGHDEDES